MSAILNLLGTLKTALAASAIAVSDSFDPAPFERRKPPRYLVLGVGKINSTPPEITADGTIYPLEVGISLSLYDLPDADANSMIACLEDEILGRLLDAGIAPVQMQIAPVCYDRTTDKRLLCAELTLACGYQRKAAAI